MQKVRLALLVLFLTILGVALLQLASIAVNHFSASTSQAFTTQQHQIPR